MNRHFHSTVKSKMKSKPTRRFLLAIAWGLAAVPAMGQGLYRFDSIFTVHTERTPYCPPDYYPDAKYRACCYGSQKLTSAPGPDSQLSYACCATYYHTCTGPPPIMYDWTTDEDGKLVVITPTGNIGTVRGLYST